MLTGENTDGKGFVEGVRQVTSVEGKRVLIFGAGGAAKAVSVELALAGASNIQVVNRSKIRGQELVDLINAETEASAEFIVWDRKIDVPENTDIVINATSVGLYPDVDEQLNMNPDSLLSHMVVADGIHNPPKTHLLKAAISRNCRTVDGLTMLVNQGVLGIKFWTGKDASEAVMRETLNKVLHQE